jgi:hypothetical protein
MDLSEGEDALRLHAGTALLAGFFAFPFVDEELEPLSCSFLIFARKVVDVIEESLQAANGSRPLWSCFDTEDGLSQPLWDRASPPQTDSGQPLRHRRMAAGFLRISAYVGNCFEHLPMRRSDFSTLATQTKIYPAFAAKLFLPR